MKKLIPILFISLSVVVFFWQFFFKGLLPIPSDTIIGLYHPFRDLYAKNYPNGIPFKNFLITDPVRQQYPWRELAVSIGKKMELPLWNPYNFSGTPLLANFQSAPFYLFNILFFVMPFATAWSLIIFLGPLLSGILLFLYLDNLKLNKWASLVGSISYAFSGFFVAWMEWGTITHVGLWLPLMLLAIDKIFLNQLSNSKFIHSASSGQNSKLQFKIKNYFWPIIFIFSLISAFFAGHLQTFFYLFIFSWVYFLARWTQHRKIVKILFAFLIFNILFLILTSIQWIPTFQFIQLSARSVDQVDIANPGWFIPWQHLVQFVAPDFFGNPTTLNYWGVWNYGELVGYVGIIPLILAIFSLLFRRDKKTLFFGTFLILSLVFSFPTLLAKIPYFLEIPFLNTAQPTRLLFISTFCLAILAALGFDYLFKTKKKISIIYPLIFISIILASLWIFIPNEHMSVVKNNLFLPTLLLAFSWILFIALIASQKKRIITMIICVGIVVIAAFDLLRFGWKFEPFTQKVYLFPSTKTLSFLQKNLGEFRVMSVDSRILPPNFSAIYRIKSIDGYDPLYILRYGELIAASERSKPDIAVPFGFNRIVTPKNYESKIVDLLGVKYILSLKDLLSPKLEKVFQEGETRVYENKDTLPRAFFVEEVKVAESKNDVIEELFKSNFVPTKTAVVEKSEGVDTNPPSRWTKGTAAIVHYSENEIVIDTKNTGDGFLVLTDSYYPIWHAAIDGIEAKIYRTDYNFRGVIVPAGKHKVEFYNSLF